jgi:hypothetical protein
MTREEQFEARYWHLAGIPKIAAWQAWKAATNVALEQAEKACEAIKNDRWALYKGRPPYTGTEPGRADNYVFPAGMPDACEHGDQGCTDIIKRDKTNALLPDNAKISRPREAGNETLEA